LKTRLSTLFSVFLLSISLVSWAAQEIPSDEASVKAGKKLFTNNCKSCHAINSKVVGPALSGVTSKYDTEWLLKWISNAPALIAEGDEKAVKVYEENKASGMMNAFTSLKSEQILSILSYINTGGEKEAKAPPVSNDLNLPVQTQTSDNGNFNIILGVILVVLVLIIGVLALLTTVLLKTLKNKEEELDEDDKEFINNKTGILSLVKNPIFLGVGGFVSTLIVVYLIITKVLYGVGVSQGYAPKQPIPFSHKIHAGQLEIDCQYCHTGVRKSKNANIPSANICMNCHKYVKTESSEIKKIHEAIGYNKETGEYSGETKPIEWIRIHNLPDLAYFNHSQHVQVAGLDCQECHGKIKDMDVVYQYAPLTMGWCVNCHRETNVNAKGNAYYDKLIQIHKDKSKEPMKVEDIGGLECSKCHY